jgi:hypothetical protein
VVSHRLEQSLGRRAGSLERRADLESRFHTPTVPEWSADA